MDDKNAAWKDYKQAVVNRYSDWSDIFSSLKNQKPSSDGWVTARCAFHNDKNPSFAYNRKNGRWACFAGCGKGGPIDFIMQVSGHSFKDVLLSLGDKVGVQRPNVNGLGPQKISETLVRQLTQNLQANPSGLRYLKEKRGLTDESIKRFQLGFDKIRNRFAIPVFDEKKRPVNIRFYSPTKDPKIQNLKGFGSPARLYGLEDVADQKGKPIIFCEGEFDCMLLRQNEFLAVTSTHGCGSFRQEWIPNFKDREVIVVYDCDPEGQAAAEAVVLKAFKESGIASVKNVRLPLAGSKEDKDVTDYLTKPHSVNGDLFEQRRFTAQDLQKLINETPVVDLALFVPGTSPSANGHDGSAFLRLINSLRNADGMKAHERQVAIAELAANHLEKIGGFFFDSKSPEEFICVNSHVHMIGNNRGFNSLMQNLGRFNVTTTEGRFVWEFVRNHARNKGTAIRSTSWVYGDPTKPVLFIHTHDENGQILRLAPNSITHIPNGQNPDKILLSPSDRVQPFRYIENQNMKEGLALLKEAIYDTAPCAEPDKAILTCYAAVVFLRDFCQMKALTRLGGPHGTGKSSITSALSNVIYGENVGKNSTPAANFTDASKNPLTILDNKEARDIDKDLLNFLLTSSTGIVHEKRKLYENQEIIRERANCFIITNGIESLGKPELISRQWDIQCDSAYFNPAFSPTAHTERILRHRDAILSAIFELIAFEVLPNLGRRSNFEIALRQKFAGHPKGRTFDCLSLILIVWDALERHIGLPSGLDEKWIRAQDTAAEETSQETDPFVQFLTFFSANPHDFPDMGIRLKMVDGRECFEVTSMQLHGLFSHLAKQHGLPQPFLNAKQLGERLTEAVPVIEKIGWRAELKARTVRGARYHRLFPPDTRDDEGATLSGQ